MKTDDVCLFDYVLISYIVFTLPLSFHFPCRPTTAAAMAQAKEWKRLVLPALLIGILGYATATAIALALGPILLRLPVIQW